MPVHFGKRHFVKFITALQIEYSACDVVDCGRIMPQKTAVEFVPRRQLFTFHNFILPCAFQNCRVELFTASYHISSILEAHLSAYLDFYRNRDYAILECNLLSLLLKSIQCESRVRLSAYIRYRIDPGY